MSTNPEAVAAQVLARVLHELALSCEVNLLKEHTGDHDEDARDILAAMPNYKIVPADEPRDWPGHTCNFGDGDNCEACDAASQRLREAVDEPSQNAALREALERLGHLIHDSREHRGPFDRCEWLPCQIANAALANKPAEAKPEER